MARRRTRRRQSGGGLWESIKALFTRKAAAEDPAPGMVMMTNPMHRDVAPAAAAAAPKIIRPRHSTFRNIAQRNNNRQTRAYSNEIQGIINENRSNKNNYNRAMRYAESQARNLGRTIPELEAVNRIREPTEEELESEFEEFMGQQYGGFSGLNNVRRMFSRPGAPPPSPAGPSPAPSPPPLSPMPSGPLLTPNPSYTRGGRRSRMTRRGGGGMTAAQIDFEANNI